MEKAKVIREFPIVRRWTTALNEIDLHCFCYDHIVWSVAELYPCGKYDPTYRIFMDVRGKEYFTQDLTDTKQKYTTMDIQGAAGWNYWKKYLPMQGRQDTIKVLSQHLFGTEDIMQGILMFQNKVHKKRIEEKTKELTIESWMVEAAGRKLPKKFEKWARSTLEPERYAFVNKIGETAQCECGRLIPAGKYGQIGECPSCGKVKYRYIREGFNCRIEVRKTAHAIQPYGDGILVRTWSYVKDYIKNKARYHLREKNRIFYQSGKKTVYTKVWCDDLRKREWRKCSEYSSYGYGAEEWLYPYNLSEVQKGTFQYAALDLYAAGPVKLIKYLDNYLKTELVESYVKLGLRKLLNDTVPNIRGQKIKEETGLNSDELRLFRKYDFGSQEKRLWNKLKEANIRVTEEEFLFFRLFDQIHKLVECLKGTTPKRLIRYLKQEKRSFKWPTLLERYDDYIRMAKALNYDLNDEFVRFPKNIKLAHDLAVEATNEMELQKEAIKNKQKDKRIRAMADLRKQLYTMESKNYMVLVPESSLDIIREGQKQHHCVASYVDRVADGETTILFLRKKEDPKEAFYTIEVRKGKVIQCRTKYNGPKTEAVEKFMKQFALVIKERWEQYAGDVSSDYSGRVG
ncbi:MAG: PcfJ domain-containing protein [Lachnospiraceae bacterium]|nr:PcfJ domain-containing protein [Lachnospiraceae bacterium]